MSTRLVVDGTLRRVHTTGGRPSATDLDSAASFFAFVANRAGLQNTAAATSLLSDYAQVLGHDTSAEMLRARFCLAPSGTGFGMRAYHALILGCVPVVIQDDGEHPRVNFDSFWWALMTIFQTLTGEDWNAAMFDAIHTNGAGAAVFFISLTVIGGYVMLNLFLAVLRVPLHCGKGFFRFV